MPDKQKGFIIPLLLITVFIAFCVLGYLFFKNNKEIETKPSIEVIKEEISSISKSSPFESITSTPVEIKWIDHIDSERGISFKLPEGWNVVFAGDNDYFEMDIHDPEADSFLLIAIQSGTELRNGSDIVEAISLAQSEKSVLTKEAAKVSDFKSSIQGTTGNYVAFGEEPYFVLKEARTLEEMEVTNYNFQERGQYEIGKKTVIFHGMTLPGSEKEPVNNKIMDSFSLIN